MKTKRLAGPSTRREKSAVKDDVLRQLVRRTSMIGRIGWKKSFIISFTPSQMFSENVENVYLEQKGSLRNQWCQTKVWFMTYHMFCITFEVINQGSRLSFWTHPITFWGKFDRVRQHQHYFKFSHYQYWRIAPHIILTNCVSSQEESVMRKMYRYVFSLTIQSSPKENCANLPWRQFIKFHPYQSRRHITARHQPLPLKLTSCCTSHQTFFSIQAMMSEYGLTISPNPPRTRLQAMSFLAQQKIINIRQVTVETACTRHCQNHHVNQMIISALMEVPISNLNSLLKLQQWLRLSSCHKHTQNLFFHP